VDAGTDFAKLLGGADAASLTRLQDHMMHFVCALAETRKLPFQVHTGLQEGSGNTISNADPTLLSNLFMEYPNVRFDLFHIGYPYQQTMSALAKNFRNVFIDFAWVHIISHEASVRALVEYLDAVPANKISGFGGDYAFIDGVAGHAFIARENIARALAVKVDQGVFDVRRAKEVARMILFDNPTALFKIDAGR
ncbi:MAG TPA: amidohydrolase family protein, partial [Planctomycetota bacterium]|nr:amidohydrolase family protein [Planctomycetota bacterium]